MHVSLHNGETFFVQVDPIDTIRQLKFKITQTLQSEKDILLESHQQSLLYLTQQLADDNKKLSDYAVHLGSTISLAFSLHSSPKGFCFVCRLETATLTPLPCGHTCCQPCLERGLKPCPVASCTNSLNLVPAQWESFEFSSSDEEDVKAPAEPLVDKMEIELQQASVPIVPVPKKGSFFIGASGIKQLQPKSGKEIKLNESVSESRKRKHEQDDSPKAKKPRIAETAEAKSEPVVQKTDTAADEDVAVETKPTPPKKKKTKVQSHWVGMRKKKRPNHWKKKTKKDSQNSSSESDDSEESSDDSSQSSSVSSSEETDEGTESLDVKTETKAPSGKRIRTRSTLKSPRPTKKLKLVPVKTEGGKKAPAKKMGRPKKVKDEKPEKKVQTKKLPKAKKATTTIVKTEGGSPKKAARSGSSKEDSIEIKCKGCNKAFGSKAKLISHTLECQPWKHKKRKKHRCPFVTCCYSDQSPSKLEIHLVSVHGLLNTVQDKKTKYKCKWCGSASFISQGGLCRHIEYTCRPGHN